MKLTDERINDLCREGEENNWTDSQFARAVIAAEDAERLKDVTPLRMQLTLMGNPIGITPDFYSAETVSALQGRIAELEAQVKSLEESLEIHAPERP